MTVRRSLTRAQKEAILDRQRPAVGGDPICPCCDKPITGATAVEFDHRRQGLSRWFFDYEGSGVDPDDPDHQYAIHARCHARLTADDASARAKTERQMGAAGQRKNRVVGVRRPFPKRADPWGKGR